jgi:hypothetical protein
MLFTKEIKLRLLEIYKANKERFEPTSHKKSGGSCIFLHFTHIYVMYMLRPICCGGPYDNGGI